MIASRGRRRVVPKGHIETGEAGVQTAAREAYEEACLIARPAIGPVAAHGDRKRGHVHRVRLLPMRVERVLEVWPEDHRRTRSWAPQRSR